MSAACSTVSLIPGPQGPAGSAGTNGADGVNAFTTANSFVMPAELGSVTITVGNSSWIGVVQNVWIVGGGVQGYFSVTAIPSSTLVTIQNLKNSATGAYATNSAAGSIFPALSQVVPAGIQGPSGTTSAGALLAANNLSDVANAVTAIDNLGLGSAATHDSGVLNSEFPPIDTTFTNGDSVWATGAGLRTKTAAAARTALGLPTLGTIATQNANAVAVTGGAIDGTVIGGTVSANATVNTLLAAAINCLGNLTVALKLFTSSTPIQTLLAADTINPNAAKVRVAGSGAPRTLTSTPSISANPLTDGQHLFIMGTDDTNPLTLQSESSLAGSKLKLGAATRALGRGDILHLLWDLNDGFWYEVSFVNN